MSSLTLWWKKKKIRKSLVTSLLETSDLLINPEKYRGKEPGRLARPRKKLVGSLYAHQELYKATLNNPEGRPNPLARENRVRKNEVRK